MNNEPLQDGEQLQCLLRIQNRNIGLDAQCFFAGSYVEAVAVYTDQFCV